MEGVRAFELKVGIFALIGIIILFIIVFSIGDIYVVKQGYHITAVFDFADGIGGSAPVRLAGVGVGQVEGVEIFRDEEANKTKVKLHAWIQEGAQIEEDSRAIINTLGLLGEKYLEIFPGTPGKRILKDKDSLVGENSVPMQEITQKMSGLLTSVSSVFDKLEKGEGTMGKLITSDTVYTDVEAVTGNLRKGEGTIGKLLTNDKIYRDLEAFVEDIKKHPWKLLSKPRGE